MSAKAKRILALLNNKKHRVLLLESLNKDTAPEGAPVTGGDKEAKFRREINSLDDDHERFMDSLKGALQKY